MKKWFLMIGLTGTMLLAGAGVTFEITPGNVRELVFPAITPKPGEKVYLEYSAYIPHETISGYNPIMEVQVNGVMLDRCTSSGAIRLVNRGGVMISSMQTTQGVEWYNPDSRLITFFRNPDGRQFQPLFPRGIGNLYRFDVTDLTANRKINKVAIRNCQSRKSKLVLNLAIEKLLLHAASPVGRELAFDLPDMSRDPQPVRRWATGDFTAELGPGGDLVVRAGGESYRLFSEFSYPAQPEMRFNRLAPRPAGGGQVAVRRDGTVRLRSVSGEYEVLRTVSLIDGMVKISDRIRNLSNHDIGIYTRYRIVPGAAFDHRKVQISGVDGCLAESLLGANPTVFVPLKKSALGMMALDDVLRSQMFASQQQRMVGVETPNLGLAPGREVTLVRLLLPQRGTDYFRFINALRRGLKRPAMTIPGPGSLRIPRQGRPPFQLLVPPLPWYDWVTEWNNAGKNAECIAKYREKRKELRQKWPKASVLILLEANLIAVDKRKIPGSEILPKNTGDQAGHYITRLSASQSALLKNHPLYDSFLKTLSGNLVADCYYAVDPMLSMQVQPAPGNARFRDLKQKFSYLLNEVKVDGIYIDQFVPERLERVTYDKWDGVSVNLNPDGTIANRFYDYLIAGIPARLELIKLAVAGGRPFMANRHTTSEQTSNIPHLRFGEQDEDFRRMTLRDSLGKAIAHPNLTGTGKPRGGLFQGSAQLSCCPMTLNIRPYNYQPTDIERYHTRSLVAALRHGIVTFNYTCWINPKKGGYGALWDMFPITPVELGCGFVIGRERIVSCVSREFSAPVSIHAPRIQVFDDHGRLRTNHASKVFRKTDGTWRINLKLWDWNETAAIIF